MKQEVEFLVSISTGWLYEPKVAEMGENVKSQDGGDRMLSISNIKSSKLHVLL